MGIKSFLATPYAKWGSYQINQWKKNPIAAQEKVFKELLKGAENTAFGKDHKFSSIRSYNDFKKEIPLRDYESLKPYIERIKNGESDVLWSDKPIYFCKTSGTTSGTKYIPISKESIHNHIHSAKIALLSYIAETGKSKFTDGKMIFLQGSPVLDVSGAIPVGRLSGIVAHHVPAYLQKNRMPSFEINCMEDWEEKVDAIVEETMRENMTLISGIPPWVQMYFEKLIEKSGEKAVKDIFKQFSLFVYGGVNFEPYRAKFERLIGKKIDSVELYPASEGFIAFQDSQKEEGMLLILNSGIFYEFVEASSIAEENPERISLKDVKLGINYAIILNTNAGLWGYIIGDTVKFVSLNPYRIVVSGRIKHFISAFGEHVIAEEVEFAMKTAIEKTQTEVAEFHVAPQVKTENELPYHEWFVEFEKLPENIEQFRSLLDTTLQQKNSYYFDLIQGNVLQPLKITLVQKGGFSAYMKSIGKLGGQNKVPRLANDRKLADAIGRFL